MKSLIPFITMLVLMNRQVVDVDSQPTTIDDGGREGQCPSSGDHFLEEIIVEMRMEMREIQRQSEDKLRAELVERDRLIANLTGQVPEVQQKHDSEMNVFSSMLDQLDGRRPMETCCWSASTGAPRLSSGRYAY